MASIDAQETLNLALQTSGLDQAKVRHRPRILSDNEPCYTSEQFTDWLAEEGAHTRGAPYHPQTLGKVERWHLTLENRTILKNCFLPGDRAEEIDDFADKHNHRRYHESLNNPTSADVYFSRSHEILQQRAQIKRRTMKPRRLYHARPID